MKHLLILIGGLILILAGLVFGARVIGEHLIEWPIAIASRQPMPDSPPFDTLLPGNIGDFRRQPFSLPFSSVPGNGAAEYRRPNDPNRIFIQVDQFMSAVDAARLINPPNWILQSSTSSKYYSLKPPIPYVLTSTFNGYKDYTLEYVNGRWNIKIDSADPKTLLDFIKVYPH